MDRSPRRLLERRAVVGVFDDARRAQQAVDALHAAGYSDEQIGSMRRASDVAESGTTSETETSNRPESGAGTGAAIGGLLGAAVALLVPGVGPVLAGGVLAHALGASAVGGAVVGAVGGAVAGGVVGTLTAMGIPEEEARAADAQFQAGRTLVTVSAPGRSDEAMAILDKFRAHDIHTEPITTETQPNR